MIKGTTYSLKYGPKYMGENLMWSGTKLLNSCEDDLRQKIEETKNHLPTVCHTGPVFFKILVDLVIASSSQSMRVLERRLKACRSRTSLERM